MVSVSAGESGSAAVGRAAALRRLRGLARLLDSSFRIPGTRMRGGLDPLLGLIPGVGDAVGAAMSLYLVAEAARLGVSRAVLARMIGNVALESAVGLVPLLGDAFDFYYKANRRNIRLLETALARER